MKSEWKTVRISDIACLNQNSFSSNDRWDSINYLDTGNITNNQIDSIQYFNTSKDKIPSRAKRKVKYNSIIFSTVRPNQKHFGIIKKIPEHFLVSTGFTVIDVDPLKANPDYVYFFLTQDNIINSLHAIAEQSVSAYPSIKPSDLGNLEIICPSLKTQNKISNILISLSKKIETNNQINKNLEEQAEAIFKKEFLSFGELPNDWKISNLLGIADYLNGLAMQKFRPDEGELGYPVLKIKELRQGICDKESEQCSRKIKQEYIIHDGDVVFSWSGSLLVDFWCGGICGLNQHLFKVSSKSFDKWFYYSWTKYHLRKFVSIAADMATTMGHIKREELEKANVFIPPKQDYERIGSLLKPIYDSIITNRIQNRELSKLRDSLLPKLMSGEIDIEREH